MIEKSSNSCNISPWKTEYEHAVASGISIDELSSKLEEELKYAEYRLVWGNKNLDDIDEIEALAKQTISYDERQIFLQTIKTSRMEKTM